MDSQLVSECIKNPSKLTNLAEYFTVIKLIYSKSEDSATLYAALVGMDFAWSKLLEIPKEIKSLYFKALEHHLGHVEIGIQTKSLECFFNAIQFDSTLEFSNNAFNRLVLAVLNNANFNATLADALILYLNEHRDLAFYFYKDLGY